MVMDELERAGYSGAGRALWTIWCLAWAGAWLVAAGLLNLGRPGLAVFDACLAAGSAAAIAAPVGKGRHR